MLWIGLMSGTSADGIDAVLAEIELGEEAPPRLVRRLAFETFEFPEEIRFEVLGLAAAAQAEVTQLARLDALLGELFAEAALAICRKADVSPTDVRAIGSHGQTIRHLPDPVKRELSFAGDHRHYDVAATLQVGDLSRIAERTGVRTVGRFRQRDVAVGGQGAPLVPAFHLALSDALEAPAAFANVGGIANITVPAGNGHGPLAFDTGPGNMVIDGLLRMLNFGSKHYDEDGEIANCGDVDNEVLEILLDHPYFGRTPPKSTGREEFGEPFLIRVSDQAAARDLSAQDTIATATALTATTVADAARPLLAERKVGRLLVCGGGVHNRALMRMLGERLEGVKVETTDAIGVDPDAVEALAFAWLAACHEQGWPGNVPEATGAAKRVVLGEAAGGNT